jgi:type II restriction enzyme
MALNKGEWSEVYTFLKLLADGRLYAADANLNQIPSIYYPILKILREDPTGKLAFSRDTKIEIIDNNGVKQLELTIEEFKNKSVELLKHIQSSSTSTFEIPDILNFMHSINITKLKAESQEKKDITIVVHDIFTGHNPILGFSIKSKLGGASTLINASGATNFIYEITPPLNNALIETINAINSKSKIRDRLSAIESYQSTLSLKKLQSDNFKRNLTMIDSQFPQILGEMLKLFFQGQGSTISGLTNSINTINPCMYDLANHHPYYEYKIKNFLTDSALGMTPMSVWSGHYDANGGYIIVKENGDLVCYHIYNRNEFQDYLFNNTKLETPSSSRHGFGVIYEEDGKQYIKLNLQVRFI